MRSRAPLLTGLSILFGLLGAALWAPATASAQIQTIDADAAKSGTLNPGGFAYYAYDTGPRTAVTALVLSIDKENTGEMGKGIRFDVYRNRDGGWVARSGAAGNTVNANLAFAGISSQTANDPHLIVVQNGSTQAINYTLHANRSAVEGTATDVGAPDIAPGVWMAGRLAGGGNRNPTFRNFLLQYPQPWQAMEVTVVYTNASRDVNLAPGGSIPNAPTASSRGAFLWASQKLLACNGPSSAAGVNTGRANYAGNNGASRAVTCTGTAAPDTVDFYGDAAADQVRGNSVRVLRYDGGATSMKSSDTFRIGLQLFNYASGAGARNDYVAYFTVK